MAEFSIPVLSGGKLNRFALYLGIGYLVVCTAYILVSGELALRVAQSPEDLATIERYKGLAFVIFSSLLFYVIARILVRRILQQDQELALQRRALLEAEMRGAAGLMAASVAHDIKNVLTLFNFQLYLLDQQQSESQSPGKMVPQLAEGVKRLNGLAQRLLTLSRSGAEQEAKRLDLAVSVRENVEFLRLHETLRSCRVDAEIGEPCEMILHRGLIDQMMLNLLINAGEAVGGRGVIKVKMYRQEDEAVIEVHDDGPGIGNHGPEPIFTAFYTTKAAGHGLGLYTVKACAELHGGSVTVERSPLGGACFRVQLPIADVAG